MTPLKAKLDDRALPPVQSTPGSAGYDLFTSNREQIHLPPRQTYAVPTGVSVEIPVGMCGLLLPRSSATLHNLRICNVIDADYRGEISVLVANVGFDIVHIRPGDRIAQLVVVSCLHGPVEIVGELGLTQRGKSGFGSTGA